MTGYLTIALSKGRLTELSVDILQNAGIDCTVLMEDTRKLILVDEKNKIKFFLAKPADVPIYVVYGAADIGIVGKDTLLEEARDLYEVLNLGFARDKPKAETLSTGLRSRNQMVFANLVYTLNKAVSTGFEVFHVSTDYLESTSQKSLRFQHSWILNF